MKQGIYKILNQETGKVYIGSTTNFKRRKSSHKRGLRVGLHHNVKLQRSWDKWGEKTFKFIWLEDVSLKASLIEREAYYVDKYNSISNGYNIAYPELLPGSSGSEICCYLYDINSYKEISFSSLAECADYLKINPDTLNRSFSIKRKKYLFSRVPLPKYIVEEYLKGTTYYVYNKKGDFVISLSDKTKVQDLIGGKIPHKSGSLINDKYRVYYTDKGNKIPPYTEKRGSSTEKLPVYAFDLHFNLALEFPSIKSVEEQGFKKEAVALKSRNAKYQKNKGSGKKVTKTGRYYKGYYWSRDKNIDMENWVKNNDMSNHLIRIKNIT